MAAALVQYQACMGIMVRLQIEDLTLLKQDFDRIGRGLSLHEFVSAMLDRVSWEPENVVAFIQDLVELFAQVDVNGDGSMEWEEFTSAIIEGGMGARSSNDTDNNNNDISSSSTTWGDWQYEENTRFVDTINREPPKRLQLVPEVRRLLLFQASRPVVEIIDPSTLFAAPDSTGDDTNVDHHDNSSDVGAGVDAALLDDNADDHNDSSSNHVDAMLFTPTLALINHFHPLCYTSGYRRDQDASRSERSPVQALAYLTRVELLAVSAGDLKLTFWTPTLLTATSTSALETPVPLAVVHTPRPQRVMEWNASTQQLFTISADLWISVWRVHRVAHSSTAHGTPSNSSSRCDVTLVATLKHHTDLLQDLLSLNDDTLVSCSMDGLLVVWDTTSLTPRATRRGHRRGVRLLTKWSPQLFLSAGFDCGVFAWDLTTTTPLFKLEGHLAPVCCLQLIASAAFTNRMAIAASTSAAKQATALLADQAITVDDAGWFKWWNLLQALASDVDATSNRVCIQTFRVGTDMSPWRAHALAVLNNGQSILAAGQHKLKLLQRVRRTPQALATTAVLFNSASTTLLTATDRTLRIWDAASGSLLRTFRDVATSAITCVDLDTRQRKIIVGTQRGDLTVLNYLNGAILQQWPPHALQVAALVYCREDQCVLTVSWDRSLRLFDDTLRSNCLLRCVTDAHETDIQSVAYCFALSLVATGGTDGTIKLWDYLYFVLEDIVTVGGGTDTKSIDATHASVTADVNALEFIEPYPLLLSAHENGLICLWALESMADATRTMTLLVCFEPLRLPVALSSTPLSRCVDVETEVEADEPLTLQQPPPQLNSTCSDNKNKPMSGTSVSCCHVFFDERGGDVLAADIRRGRFLAFAGTSDGDICVVDVSHAIEKAGVRAIREDSLPTSHARSYNPRRRFIRQGKHAKRRDAEQHRNDSAEPNDCDADDSTAAAADARPYRLQRSVTRTRINATDVTCVGKWRAHDGNIRSLWTVDEPRAVLTCASDARVCVWSFDGECLGDVMQTAAGRSSSSSSSSTSTPATVAASSSWRWAIDLESTAQAKREQAQAIWDAMKATKQRSVVRHESVIELRRRRCHTTDSSRNSLVTSASAPTLPCNATSTEATSSTAHSVVGDADCNNAVQQRTNDATRLFAQLEGRTTWKQSDLHVARQAAWANERIKFQQRMHKIMKAKHTTTQQQQQSVDAYGQPLLLRGSGRAEQSNQLSDCLATGGDASGIFHDDTSLLSAIERNAVIDALPFSDKDNWSVGSLNREKQMYTNLHSENVRRNQVTGTSKPSTALTRSNSSSSSIRGSGAGRHSTATALNLTPSVFLLEKLGTSCIVIENAPHTMALKTKTKAKRTPTLLRSSSSNRQTQSTPTLLGMHTQVVQATSCSSNNNNNNIDSYSRSSDSAVAAATHDTMQQLLKHYDKLLAEDDDEKCLTYVSSAPASRRSSQRPELLSPRSTLLQETSQKRDSLQQLNDESIAMESVIVTTQQNKVSSAPSSRHEPVSSVDPSASAVDRPISSAKTKRVVPTLQATSSSTAAGTKPTQRTRREAASAKKQRMRSDAALLRQTHFGPHSRADILNIYRTFQQLDSDASGSITLQELRNGAGLFTGANLQENVLSVFSSIDADQSGNIDLHELLTAVVGDTSSSSAHAPPAQVLQDVLRFCDLVTSAELVKRHKKRELSPAQLEELAALFKLYDLDHDGNIDVDELVSALQYNDKFYDRNSSTKSLDAATAHMTRADVQQIVAHFDVNTNATLDFNEFVTLFRDDGDDNA